MASSRWLIVAVLVAPFGVLPASWQVDPMQAKNAITLLLALGCAVWLVRSWWLRAFLGWTVLCFVWSGAKSWGVTGIFGIFVWTLVYQASAGLTEIAWRRLRIAIAASAGVQIYWMYVQWLNVDPFFVPAMTQAGLMPDHLAMTGWFSNPMDLSAYLGLALPAVVAISPWLVLPLAGAILVLGSTVGVVGVVVTLCWLALPRVRALTAPFPRWAMRAAAASFVVLVMTGGLAAYVWALDPQGAGTRPLIWSQLVQFVRMSPVIGWGPNAIDYRLIMITPGTNLRWNFGFNEYLQGAVEFGVPGVVLALGFLGSLVWRLRTRPMGAAGELLPAVAILLLVSLFSIPFRIGPVALLVALYLGRLTALTQEAL